jgi:DNA-binding NarL/FixJ family response regulator
MHDIVAAAASRKVRVLIADGDPRTRRQLRALLEAEPDFDVVGEADDGALALQLTRWLRPNLLLLDEHLPAVRSREFAVALEAELPDVRLVLLSGTAEGKEPRTTYPTIPRGSDGFQHEIGPGRK